MTNGDPVTWEDLHMEIGKLTDKLDHKYETIMQQTGEIRAAITKIEKNCILHQNPDGSKLMLTPRENAEDTTNTRIKYLVVIGIVAILFSVLNIGFDKIPAIVKLFSMGSP